MEGLLTEGRAARPPKAGWAERVLAALPDGIGRAEAMALTVGHYLRCTRPGSEAARLVLDRSGLAAAANTAPETGVSGVAGVAGTPDGEWELGRVLEGLGARVDRRRRGQFFTPPGVARRVVDEALHALRIEGAPVVCDPCCGGGAFLVCAADALVDAGHSPRRVLGELIVGFDIDPLAVVVARAALWCWWLRVGGSEAAPPPDIRVRVGDSILGDEGAGDDVWQTVPAGIGVVVGNPPFLSQLRGEGVRSPVQRDLARARHGDRAHPYLDTAGLAFMEGVARTLPGGTVGMVLPRSLTAAASAAGMRDWVGERTDLVAEVDCPSGAFDAAVEVFVPVVRVTTRGSGSRWLRGHTRHRPDRFKARDVFSGVLADVATGGAGFRDEFYAVARAVVECDEAAPGDGRVVTSGLIDPAWCRWGQCTARIGGAVWLRPGLDRSRLDAVGRRWVEARRGPKVLVASQTRVIEAVVDPSGDLVPITPVVSLHPRDGVDPWLVAAALSSPAASRWLAGRRGGSGLSSGSIRVSVGDLLACPLPADREAWRVGAALFRSAQETPPGPEHDGLLVRFGTTMLAAGPIGANERDWDEWGGIDGIMSWWVQGLPRRSGTG